MQLNVPVHQTITLPDEWQACKTPQELSYWLVAKLDGIQAAIDELSGGGGDLTELQEQVTALQTKVDALNSRVAGLTQTTVDVQGGIEENKTNIATNTTNIATLRTDLQTTNENLSGFEDRVGTNAANISSITQTVGELSGKVSEFESTYGAYEQRYMLYLTLKLTTGTKEATFNVALVSSVQETVPTTGLFQFLERNTSLAGVPIVASGFFGDTSVPETFQIIAVNFSTGMWQFRCYSAGTIQVRNMASSSAVSNLSFKYYPVGSVISPPVNTLSFIDDSLLNP